MSSPFTDPLPEGAQLVALSVSGPEVFSLLAAELANLKAVGSEHVTLDSLMRMHALAKCAVEDSGPWLVRACEGEMQRRGYRLGGYGCVPDVRPSQGTDSAG